MAAFAAAADFVKDAVRDEPVKDLAQRRERGERLCTVASGIDNLHGGPACLANLGRTPSLRASPRASAKGYGVFSVPDIMVVSVLALLLFGPEQLPKMMRQAGRVMREVQNTSHSFIAEMERAADVQDRTPPPMPPSPHEDAKS